MWACLIPAPPAPKHVIFPIHFILVRRLKPLTLSKSPADGRHDTASESQQRRLSPLWLMNVKHSTSVWRFYKYIERKIFMGLKTSSSPNTKLIMCHFPSKGLVWWLQNESQKLFSDLFFFFFIVIDFFLHINVASVKTPWKHLLSFHSTPTSWSIDVDKNYEKTQLIRQTDTKTH